MPQLLKTGTNTVSQNGNWGGGKRGGGGGGRGGGAEKRKGLVVHVGSFPWLLNVPLTDKMYLRDRSA